MTTNLKTGHVGLNVTNLERSRDFYQQVFDFRLLGQSLDEGRRYAFLGNENSLLVTLWEQSEGQFPTHQPGLHHLSFQVDSIDQVEAAEQRVREAGAKLIYEGIVPHSEGAQSGGIFFEDPDGLRLEIFTSNAATHQPAPSDGPSCGFF